MSYALSGSANEDDDYSKNNLLHQTNDGTGSKHLKELGINTSWLLQDLSNFYRNNNSETISGNKNRNNENRKPKMRKVFLSKDLKCRCDTAPKCTGACRPKGYKVISQDALDLMGKPTLRNDSLRPKYVVTKRDPKLRPLEEVAPRKAKRREHLVIRNDQQASCSTRKLQKREWAEKTTYCRPVLDFVNEDSVAKNAERNNRLQNVVQKLIEVRQIQKQRETWNNFINELKTRHELNTVHTTENELINDYGNVRFNVQPAIPRPVRYYIEDMYPHSSSTIEQEIKSNIDDYQLKLDNSHLLYGAHPYPCYPNMGGKTSKQANNTCDFLIYSESKRHGNDFYTPRQKYKRKTAYVPSDSSVPSKDSDNDYTLTDNEESRTQGGRKNKYRQQADRVTRRKSTPNNETVQNFMTLKCPGQRIRKTATKKYTEQKENRSSITNKTNTNVSDCTFKQNQIEGQYKKLFKDIATYKEQHLDENSLITLENIENKLDLLIQGISELLQEIKPKCNLINEAHDKKVSGQYFKENNRCQDCVGNDSVFRLIMTNKTLKQEIPKQTVPKREITKSLSKSPRRSIKKSFYLVEDDKSDEESDGCCKHTFSFDRSDQSKTCHSRTRKLLDAYYDKYEHYDDKRSKEYDKCSVHDNPLVDEYDRREQDDDTVTEGKDQVSTPYYLNSKDRVRTSAIVEENQNSREQPHFNTQNEDSYGCNGVAQDIGLVKCIIYDESQNEICSKFINKQTVDEEYEKRKNNHCAQNKDNGTEKRKSCVIDTWNKRKISGDLSQKCDERCLKFKIKSNENYDKIGEFSTSGCEKNPQQEHVYAKERPLFLNTTSVRPKTYAEKNQLYAPKTQGNLPSSCRRPKSREPRQCTNHTSEENSPFLKKFFTKETERDCFRDMYKNMRSQELEKRRQSTNDEIVSQLKKKVPGPDTFRHRCRLHKDIKEPEPPIITGTLSRSGPNAQSRRYVQDYIKQTWSYETKTCQRHEAKDDASDVGITNESKERNNEKDACVVEEISRDSDTKFDRIIKVTEQDQGSSSMLYFQGELEHGALGRKDDILESSSNFEARKLIDDSTSVNRVLNVSRGSSTEKNDKNKHRFKKEEQYTCALVKNLGSPFCNNHRYENSKMDKIIIEEMNKSDRAKKDIDDILNGEFSNAVSFTFDVPTRERATEVTNSLSAAVPHGGNEFYSYDSANRTITTVAVNTDPMGLLALLRLTTDTLRYLLGQMNLYRIYSPLAYIAQLSVPRSLPLPSLTSMHNDIPGFICNICGSVFPSRSQLSLHDIEHRNDIYRGCCVCRHLLDMRKRRHTGLFTCVYCGQCFTRAYCCELHQHVCARKRGLKHDVVEKLSILR